MSLRIIKKGVQDLLQDHGRFGYQHLGIHPGGVMDGIAMGIANALVGNSANATVLEMVFPAATLLFEADCLIALSGADFGATIEGQPIPINQPVVVNANSQLTFSQNKNGAYVYLAIHGGFEASAWLGSTATETYIAAGGFQGRALQKGDVLKPLKAFRFHFSGIDNTVALPWHLQMHSFYTKDLLRLIPGKEYALLTGAARDSLVSSAYQLQSDSNRMGFRLSGLHVSLSEQREMLSTAVTRGTIQLLPDGNLIVLMADHQTTGGYPRIAHVISADLPSLAQQQPGKPFSFSMITLEEAEKIWLTQQTHLQQLQNACNLRIQEYFSAAT